MDQHSSLEKDVRDLVHEVRSLSTQLAKFPEREEVFRNYVTRAESRKRISYFIIFVILSVSLAYGLAITTISTCFLTQPPYPSGCSAMPGYKDTQETNQEIIKQFKQLQEITQRNDRRLDRLEGE